MGSRFLLVLLLQQGAGAEILLQPMEVQIHFSMRLLSSERTYFTNSVQGHDNKSLLQSKTRGVCALEEHAYDNTLPNVTWQRILSLETKDWKLSNKS